MKAADVLEDRAGDFEAVMQSKIGTARAWAQFKVHLAASMLREAGGLTTQAAGEVIPSDQPGCFSLSIRAPVGVVPGIAPWDAPVVPGL